MITLSFVALHASAQGKDNDDDASSFEIGTGGNITVEKNYRTEIEENYNWNAHLLYESRYVTEGRDNLDGHGLYSASTEFIYDDLNIVPWVATGSGIDYTEIDLNVIYGTRLFESFSGFIGYNHIRLSFNDHDFFDNEINAGFVYLLADNLQATANVYYSFKARGSFAEAALNKDFFVSDHSVINLSTTLGFNAGYIVYGHDGANNAQLQAKYSYLVTRPLDVYVYAGYNYAINRDASRYVEDALLRDFFWGGAGLSYRF